MVWFEYVRDIWRLKLSSMHQQTRTLPTRYPDFPHFVLTVHHGAITTAAKYTVPGVRPALSGSSEFGIRRRSGVTGIIPRYIPRISTKIYTSGARSEPVANSLLSPCVLAAFTQEDKPFNGTSNSAKRSCIAS